jgi:predicted permease
VIGVMPPRFGWYGNDTLWLPLALNRRDRLFLNPIVRLATGTSREAAEAQLHAFYQGRAKQDPSAFPAQGFTTRLINYMDITVASGDMRTSLRLLLGAVGFLLLIACANVANLQLARGTARAREIAVRASIGASRRRLVRQLLTESVLLSVVGGVAGVLFAFGAIKTIVALMPEFYVPNEARVAINTPVLLFSVVVAVLTGIVFGLAPAMQGSRPDVTEALRSGRGAADGARGGRTRNLLVVAEVTLAVVLLVSASLMVRTFLVLQSTDSGLRSENVLMVSVPLPAVKYPTLERRNQFAEQLLERAAALPGVQSATIGNGGTPFGGLQSPLSIIGRPTPEQRRVAINLVGSEHLETYGIPLRSGRMFDPSEVRRGARVALVNEAAAALWPAGENPINAQLAFPVLERPPAPALAAEGASTPLTVIGVIANVRNAGFREPPMPAVLVPYTVIAPLQRTLSVRTAGDPLLLLNSLRVAVREMDPEQPLGRPITLAQALGQQSVQPRFTMALFSAFAGLGLLIAAAGIYSVLSFHAARRTQELGVRMALGAPRRHVLGIMLWMAAKLIAAGLIVGITVSLLATRVLRSQLFGVSPADPASYAVVAALLVCVALAAAYIPARRASAIDPLVALRQE